MSKLLLTAKPAAAQALVSQLLGRPLAYRCGAPCTWCTLVKADRTVISLVRNIYFADLRTCCALARLGSSNADKVNPEFVVQIGDDSIHHAVQPGRPVFTKTRPVATRCGALLPLEYERHWARGAKGISTTPLVPWEKKVPNIVWRGAPTGSGQRRDFVHALSPYFDVRFHNVGLDHSWVMHPNHTTAGGRHKMTHASLMRAKYALSVEGNDVATNLKWLLAQNSVVIMPTPRHESWLMEGLLRPWVHYVPLDEPSEARERVQWMEAHEEDCLRIVHNANAWMATILDKATWEGDVQRVMRSALKLQHIGGSRRTRVTHANESTRSRTIT